MGQHLSDAPREIATLTFDLADDGPLRQYGSSFSIYTKFEIRRPFCSEDMMHFWSQHYVGLVTLTFAIDLETGAHYCP